MPRFCSFCGERIGRRAPAVCPGCGGAHWPRMSPAAGALVVHAGKLLLIRRGIEPWLGAWCAPGGFCHEGETLAEAAVRETLEEAGVEIAVTGRLGDWVDEYTPAGDDGLDASYCCVTYFHARLVSPSEPRVDGAETVEWGWFAPHELPRPLAPTGNADQIYAAWRDAVSVPRRPPGP